MHAWGEGAPQNSPVHKAVTPVEAATVDKVDTFFEVLFAGEESNMDGNAGVGEAGLSGAAFPSLTVSEGQRPWILSAASMQGEGEHCLGTRRHSKQRERLAPPSR